MMQQKELLFDAILHEGHVKAVEWHCWAPAVREDHAAAEHGDRDAMRLMQLLQEHFHGPLAAAIPGHNHNSVILLPK